MSKKSMYCRWNKMLERCYSSSYHAYHRYGGRGIVVCERWKNSFEDFYSDLGEPPFDKAEIDRIDNDGNYEPSNIRWVTHKENCNNRKPYSNKTGFTGVHYKPHLNKYSAYFYVNRKQKHVGVFDTPEEAYKERVNAIKKYNKDYKESLKYIEYEDIIKNNDIV